LVLWAEDIIKARGRLRFIGDSVRLLEQRVHCFLHSVPLSFEFLDQLVAGEPL
jgi:hypothetical protein